jgi:hypothetical protein
MVKITITDGWDGISDEHKTFIERNEKHFTRLNNPRSFLKGEYDLGENLVNGLKLQVEQLLGETNPFLMPQRVCHYFERYGHLLIIRFADDQECLTKAEIYAYESITQWGAVTVWVIRGDSSDAMSVHSVCPILNGKVGEEAPCDVGGIRKMATDWYTKALQQKPPRREKKSSERRYVRNLPKEDIEPFNTYSRWAVAEIFENCFGYTRAGKPLYPSDVDAGFIVNSSFVLLEGKYNGNSLKQSTEWFFKGYLQHNDGGLVAFWTDGDDVIQIQIFDGKSGNIDVDPQDCTNAEWLERIKGILHNMAEMIKPNKLHDAVMTIQMNLKEKVSYSVRRSGDNEWVDYN